MNDTALRELFARFLAPSGRRLGRACSPDGCPGFFRDGDTGRLVTCDECCHLWDNGRHRPDHSCIYDEDVRVFVRQVYRRALSRRIGDVAVRDYIRDTFGTFQEFGQ